MIVILIVTARGQGVGGGPFLVHGRRLPGIDFKNYVAFFRVWYVVCVGGFLLVSAYFSGAHVDPPNVTPYVFLPILAARCLWRSA